MDTQKTFTVSVTFTDMEATSPLEAAKIMAKWLSEDYNSVVYDVLDEETHEKYTVDLAEDDEDAVLPNND